MHRLLVGTCILALAVIAVRADEEKKEKSPQETFKALFTELVSKYRAASTDKARHEVLTTYGNKLVDLAKANLKEDVGLEILGQVVTFPLPPAKDGPIVRSLALLKNMVADKTLGKKTRSKALQAYLGALESIISAKRDETLTAEAKKDLAEARKLVQGEFKGVVKDLFVGAPMPELKSKNLEDKPVKLSDLKGKVVVLDIWATWCPPCRAMIPHERELVKKLKDKPFVLVSISADAKKDTLENFLKDNPMPWTHWWNGRDGSILSELDVKFFPTIYVLDHKGVIRYKNVRDKDMDKAVETLLKEMENEKKTP
jgi:thiol-disulfide isomerase/thioredoxin